MMEDLKYFLGLQIHQTRKGTFINQVIHFKEFLNIFYMGESKKQQPKRHSYATLTNMKMEKQLKKVSTEL